MNFQEYINKNKLKVEQIRQLLPGKQVKILSRSHGHTNTVGQIFTIPKEINRSWITAQYISSLHTTGGNGAVYYAEMEVHVNTASALRSTIEHAKETIRDLKEQLQRDQKKLDYLEYHKLTELDEKQYQAYEIVQLLKTDGSDVDKAKAIAQLL